MLIKVSFAYDQVRLTRYQRQGKKSPALSAPSKRSLASGGCQSPDPSPELKMNREQANSEEPQQSCFAEIPGWGIGRDIEIAATSPPFGAADRR